MLMACSEVPTDPGSVKNVPSMDLTANTYQSGADVMTWDPILPGAADPTWPTTTCTTQPAVGPDANWQNPHNAYVLTGHPWAYSYFYAPWINAWNYLASIGPAGQSWTKYSTQVSGNGSFVVHLLADNCSWVYLDNTLVGVQNTNLAANSYGVTLNGTHTLSFIIFDGGGAAGGKFLLETTTNPPPPLNPDLDDDGHLNDDDAFPLDPTRWQPADTTPPVVTPVVTGTMGDNAWYTSDVSVSWNVSDAESDITSAPCETSTVSSDTDGMTTTCSATSEGGTSTGSVSFKRDATNPVVAFSGNSGTYLVNQTVAITCSASDAMSGIASDTCTNVNAPAYSLGLGSHALNASATDNAGNSSTASTAFTVNVDAGSLCSLVRQWVTQHGVANSLCVKLNQPSAKAFNNEVRAQTGKFVPADKAAILIALATSLFG